jgi:apolipoprotein D and lipocalin family protein
MQAQNPPSWPEDDPDLDLDRRIELVEQRLVARQARLRYQFDALGQRAHAAATSGRVLVPVLAAGAALALLWLMLRKRLAHRHLAPHDEAPRSRSRSRSRLATLLWSQVPALVVAMLPARLHAGTPFAGGSAWVGALLPLLRRRQANPADGAERDTDESPMPVVGVDLQRFAGSWLQLARLAVAGAPANEGLSTLTFNANGREFEVQRRRLRPGRRALTEQGVVRVVPGSNGARLRFSFAPAWLHWLPMAWEDHWVLHIEPDYSAALVGNPQRTRLALLVRRFRGCEAAVKRMLASARLQGFAVEDLEFASSAVGPPAATPRSESARAAAR